jgi:uncharacterized protein (DUF488 family)
MRREGYPGANRAECAQACTHERSTNGLRCSTGISKSSHRAAVEEDGIAYRHFRDLGTPAEGRAAARRGDHARLSRIYSGQLELPEALKQMAELRALAEDQRVCLLCYERDAAECHRALLFDALLDDFERIDLEPVLVTP